MTSMDVTVDDILDQLWSENRRLLKELLFANKCLKIFNQLRNELNLIYKKFETQLNTEDKFNHLRHQLNLIYQQNSVYKDLAIDDDIKCQSRASKVVINSGNGVIDIQDISYLPEETVICEPLDILVNEVVIDGTQDYDNNHSEDDDEDEQDVQEMVVNKTNVDYSDIEEEQQTTPIQSTNEMIGDCDQQNDGKISQKTETNAKKIKTKSMFAKVVDKCGANFFKCLVRNCDKKFNNMKTLRRHQRNQHQIRRSKLGRHICHYKNCDYETKVVDEFVKHIQYIHRDDRPFACLLDNCKKAFKEIKDLKSHQTVHISDDKQLEEEEEKDNKTDPLYEKIIDYSGAHVFRCLFRDCLKKFSSIPSVIRHQREGHHIVRAITGIGRNRCHYDNCNFETIFSRDFIEHMSYVHQDDRPFICRIDDCLTAFKKIVDLREHQSKCHFSLPEQSNNDCTIKVDDNDNDNKEDIVLQAINEVIDNYGDDQSDNRLFDKITDNSGHLMYRCLYSNCYKQYTSRQSVLFHWRTIHEVTDRRQRSHKCHYNDCNFETIVIDDFVTHMIDIHRDCRPFVCRIGNCDEAYKTYSELKNHQLIHLRGKQLKETNVTQINGEVVDKSCDQSMSSNNRQSLTTDNEINDNTNNNKLFEEITDSFGFTLRCLYNNCYKKFKNKHSLFKHQRQKHQMKRNNLSKYKCQQNDCQFVSANLSEFGRHMKDVHNEDKLFRCHYDNCNKSYKYRIDLIRHQSLHSNRLFHCPVTACNQVLPTVIQLKRHYRLFHLHKTIEFVDGSFKCRYPNCNRKYRQKSDVRRHQRDVHEGQRQRKKSSSFKCHYDGCSVDCLTKERLDRHISLVHLMETPFHCTIDGCQKAFKLKQTLDRHLLAHNKQALVCSYGDCREKFKSMVAFRYHMEEHTKTATINCTEPGCELKFLNKTHLKWHKSTVHRIKKQYLHRCPWPGCDYYGKNITQHKSVHTGVKRYACIWPKCGKSFNNPGDLEGHMNVHKNIKPYACTWPGCDYRCAHSTGLQHHLMSPMVVTIDDILDQLWIENKRLVNELLFANKLKTFLLKLFDKYEEHIDGEDKHEFKQLQEVIKNRIQLRDNEYEEEDSHVVDRNINEINVCNSSSTVRSTDSMGKVGSDETNIYKRIGQEVCQLKVKGNEDNSHIRDIQRQTNDENVVKKSLIPIKIVKITTNNDQKESYQFIPMKATNISDGRPTDKSINNKISNNHDLDDRPFECPIDGCLKTFKRNYELVLHNQAFHSNLTPSQKTFLSNKKICKSMEKTNNENVVKKSIIPIKIVKITTNNDQKESYQFIPVCRPPVSQPVDRSTDRLFRCRVNGCLKTFKKNYELVLHELEVHSKTIGCEFDGCRRKFRLNHEMKQHLAEHNNQPKQVMDKSDSENIQKVDNINQVIDKQKDVSVVHKSTDITTTNDQKEGSIITKIYNKHDLEDGPFECPIDGCLKTFKINYELVLHKQRVHSNRTRGQKIFLSNKKICKSTEKIQKKKMIFDQISGKYKCRYDDCDKKFNTKSALRYHERIHHERDTTKWLNCQYTDCQFQCLQGSNMKEHLNSKHSDVKTFVCSYSGCTKAYKTSRSLRIHSLIHTNTVHKCVVDGCQRKFRHKTNLTRHMAEHKSEPTLKCPVKGCLEKFFSDKEIFRHRRKVHNIMYRKGIKHRCDWPGCDWIGYGLSFHKKQHLGEKPFVCDWPQCDKRFITLGNLQNHLNVHNNVKPYVCLWPGCDYRCANGGNIITHRKRVHEMKL
ncbi:uncharacterized protein LOC128954746 [Oppia nitens]|uniref:uncharacterized protein LOC128954746 n=1 Tax=Oppia nitens TaxID=1686743 RepID=UPI0023DA35C0|nr:uncharacterized protein LOC128954746 [Oppia nitens]